MVPAILGASAVVSQHETMAGWNDGRLTSLTEIDGVPCQRRDATHIHEVVLSRRVVHDDVPALQSSDQIAGVQFLYDDGCTCWVQSSNV